jgi:hypothetical protein
MILRKEPVRLAFLQDSGETSFNEAEGLVCAEVGLAVTPEYPIRSKPTYSATHIPSGFGIMRPFSRANARKALELLAVLDWREVGPSNMPDEYHDLVKQVKKEMSK